MSRLARDLIYNRLVSSALLPTRWRWRVLRALGFDIQPSLISSGCFIGTRTLRVAEGVSIGYDCFFDTLAEISLGENVTLSPHCRLITSTHEIGPAERRCGDLLAKPITVGAGSWLGAGVTVMPGVQIGRGAVVAAGALVTRNLDDDALYAGVPAVRVRALSKPGPELRAVS